MGDWISIRFQNVWKDTLCHPTILNVLVLLQRMIHVLYFTFQTCRNVNNLLLVFNLKSMSLTQDQLWLFVHSAMLNGPLNHCRTIKPVLNLQPIKKLNAVNLLSLVSILEKLDGKLLILLILSCLCNKVVTIPVYFFKSMDPMV